MKRFTRALLAVAAAIAFWIVAQSAANAGGGEQQTAIVVEAPESDGPWLFLAAIVTGGLGMAAAIYNASRQPRE